jgi:amino acid adenylation domain-containing protein
MSQSAAVVLKQLSALEKRSLLTELLEKRRNQRCKVCPVSFSQRRLWFLDQLAPRSPFYNIDIVVPLPSGLDVHPDVFDRTIIEIVRRHDSLRTTFEAEDGEPMQVIAPSPSVRVEKLDLRQLSVKDQEIEAKSFASEQLARPFDLSRGPLLRAALVHLHDRHVLVLVMHHIICDGWSMGVFFQEFLAIYDAFRNGLPSPLPEPPIQYSDFAVWQRGWLQGEVLEDQLRYWRQKLEGIPVLNLPSDRPRPPVQTFRGAFEPIHMPRSVMERLKSLAEQESVTLFMVLLAAFQVVLSRYANQDDIAVGTYIANRNRKEVEQVIGFFINTLVMRTDLGNNPSVRELLARVKETALGAYAHQDTPFETLVEALQPERDLSRNPLFQVVFQLFNAPNVDTRSESSGETMPVVEKRTAIFDIAFSSWETSDGLGGGFEYSTDLFDAATIRRMAAHYRNVLEAMAHDPSQGIQDLPLLSAEERRRAIVEWNTTAVERDWNQNLMQMFWAVVASAPRNVAVIAGEKEVTYRELGDRVGQLAGYLEQSGVGPERLVGICLERSLDAVASVLAVFEAGAAYVPMDPSYPLQRLDFIVRDASLTALITRSGFAAGLAHANSVRIDLDLEDATIRRQPAQRRNVATIPADRLAYAIYTSGSTGKPKGVAVEHRQILNRLAWMWREYPFAAGEVGCQKTSLTFDDSLWEMLGPLLRGIPSVIVSEAPGRDPRALLEVIAAHRVSRLWLVASLLRELLFILECDSDLRERLQALRFWVTSGEALSPQLAEQFSRTLPSATLYNLYGTSEVWDATWHDPHRDGAHPGRVPIGRPIDNVQAFIVTRGGAIAPIGVPGELCIGGAGLAREYLNRPELTQEKFVRHLFQPEGRLYRTGDSARYLPDGQIEFLGRMDGQVKIRGFRVELGEIEALLSAHPDVREAAVLTGQGVAGTQLVAYVAMKPGAKASHLDLVEFLQKQLPAHMIPSSFVLLDELPKTTSGKLDRTALIAVKISQVGQTRSYTAPRTPMESKVVELYQQVLERESVGVDDHFFRDLGGHSLLATRLASRVRNTFHVEVPLQAFFEAPTPSALAQVLSQLQLEA